MERSSISKLSHKRAPSAPAHAPPLPPPRVRGGTKHSPLPSRQALDVDGVGVKDPKSQVGDPGLENLLGDLSRRKGRIRKGVYHTSHTLLPDKPPIKPTMKTTLKPSKGSHENNEHSKTKATFV